MTPEDTSADPAAPTDPPGASGANPDSLGWIPIRTLSPSDREAMVAHLLALAPRDRYLRFGYSAGDEQIARYVDGIDFQRDEVFGVFNRKLVLIALAHLACPADAEQAPRVAEFGGSVAEHARGRGYGARLFGQAMLHARNRGLDTLFIHALSENTVMLKIARNAGAVVEREGSEADAFLRLPQDTVASQVEQWVGRQAAAIDYQLKQKAQVVEHWRDAIGEVRKHLGDLPGGAAKD